MDMHPQAAAFLARVADWQAETGAPAARDTTPGELRRFQRSFAEWARPPTGIPIGLRTERLINGERPVDVHVYRPEWDTVLPILIYFHGGGYVVGSSEESENELTRLATEVPALVAAVDYSLAPENPLPEPIDDGVAALDFIKDQAVDWGGDPARIGVCGCSAGGGVAAAVARLAAARTDEPLRIAALLCPWLDLSLSQPSIDLFGEGYGLDRVDLEWFARHALTGGMRSDDALVSPALHDVPKSLAAGMAPTVILVAECDPLRDEAYLYADRLRSAGVPVDLIAAPGMTHAFNLNLEAMPAGAETVARAVAAIRTALNAD